MEDLKYNRDNFFFIYRVSALIFNKDKTKILLFYGNDSDFYMLPGGKVKEFEKSRDAINREIKEEIGYDNLEYDLIGISEELVKNEENNIHQLTLTYKSTYNGEISDLQFKSKESDWINFKWVEIEELENYNIHPKKIIKMVKNNNTINHLIEEIIN